MIKRFSLRKQQKNSKGITLIELLVAVSILGILTGITGDLLFTIFRAYNKARVVVDIQEEGNAIMNRIRIDAINATSAKIVPDGNDNVELVLVQPNASTITYEIKDWHVGDDYKTLVRRVNGGPEENLFQDKYKLFKGAKYSTFRLFNEDSTPTLLVVYITVIPAAQTDNTPKDMVIEQQNAQVRTAIVLRGTYDRIN